MNLEQMKPEKLISIKEMMTLLDKARPTIYKMVQDGRLPKPVKVNNRTQGWTVSSYKKWLEKRTISEQENEVTELHKAIEKWYGSGVLMQFVDIVNDKNKPQ